jgi:hypothetical protein
MSIRSPHRAKPRIQFDLETVMGCVGHPGGAKLSLDVSFIQKESLLKEAHEGRFGVWCEKPGSFIIPVSVLLIGVIVS